MLLNNRVALVTGAGRGLGKGIANVLYAHGAKIVVGDIANDEVQKTAKEIRSKGGDAISVHMDITSLGDVESAFDIAYEKFGKVDILINNAGIVHLEEFFNLTSDAFTNTLEVNVTGTFLCSQVFARRIKEIKLPGNIVNISSNAGKVGYAGQLDYNASKAAVINLTRIMALELAPYKINVNAVCPGAVETEMLLECAQWITDKAGGDAYKLMQTFAPSQLGRLIRSEEVGEVVAFLASDKAAIIRGESLNVDAGNTPY